MEGWKDGRVEGWKGGRVEGLKDALHAPFKALKAAERWAFFADNRFFMGGTASVFVRQWPDFGGHVRAAPFFSM